MAARRRLLCRGLSEAERGQLDLRPEPKPEEPLERLHIPLIEYDDSHIQAMTPSTP